uniref:Uncharacterized protein n=1 Tax=Cafeteria roenbergensis TaxID=33653 RepID=A0A7S0JX36_CAFRO|mmetsp:Transcript_18902/g.72071  ORF Transcript_18902/g.72071 Transcript_18902/m.72071 type:complete len:143 (+) Transcript_18902:46-474(+)
MLPRAADSLRPPGLVIPAPEDFGDYELAPRAPRQDACPAAKASTPRSPDASSVRPAKVAVIGCRSGPGSAASPGLQVAASLASTARTVPSASSGNSRSLDLTDDPESPLAPLSRWCRATEKDDKACCEQGGHPRDLKEIPRG